MPLYDKPLEELLVYDPPMTREADFESFWAETLAESVRTPLNAYLEDVSYPAIGVRAHEAYYDGWRGARICAWYLVPEGEGPFPALVQYHGYSGGKRGIHNYLPWALQGYVVLALDVRGQAGKSSNPGPYTGGHVMGWMTQGHDNHRQADNVVNELWSPELCKMPILAKCTRWPWRAAWPKAKGSCSRPDHSAGGAGHGRRTGRREGLRMPYVRKEGGSKEP